VWPAVFEANERQREEMVSVSRDKTTPAFGSQSQLLCVGQAISTALV
jgi:hypothetical protein